MGGFVSRDSARWIENGRRNASSSATSDSSTLQSCGLRALKVTDVVNNAWNGFQYDQTYKYKAQVMSGLRNGSGQSATVYAEDVNLWSRQPLLGGEVVYAILSHAHHWEAVDCHRIRTMEVTEAISSTGAPYTYKAVVMASEWQILDLFVSFDQAVFLCSDFPLDIGTVLEAAWFSGNYWMPISVSSSGNSYPQSIVVDIEEYVEAVPLGTSSGVGGHEHWIFGPLQRDSSNVYAGIGVGEISTLSIGVYLIKGNWKLYLNDISGPGHYLRNDAITIPENSLRSWSTIVNQTKYSAEYEMLYLATTTVKISDGV